VEGVQRGRDRGRMTEGKHMDRAETRPKETQGKSYKQGKQGRHTAGKTKRGARGSKTQGIPRGKR
jgi:hypothetical protein